MNFKNLFSSTVTEVPRKFFIMLGLFVLPFLSPIFADAHWTLALQQNGIMVYTRPVEGSEFEEFMGVSIFDSPIEVVGEVLMDVPNHCRWMADCQEVRVVQQYPGVGNLMQYYSIRTPWPVSNRDVVIRTASNIDLRNGRVVVSSSAVQEDVVPLRSDHVRIKKLSVIWILERLETNKTRVSYMNKTDPGGSLPVSLTNSSSRNTPLVTLGNMREMAKQPSYIDAAAKRQR